MLSTRLHKNSINIICSKNQQINTNNLKDLYRTVLKFKNQNNKLPVIVELERNVQVSNSARNLFNKIEEKCTDQTLIIIAA